MPTIRQPAAGRSPRGKQVSPARPPAVPAWAVCVGLALAVAVVFGQTVRFQFVNYDDCQYVYHNKHVTDGLTRGGMTWAFTSSMPATGTR